MKAKETALIRVTVETKKKLDNMKSIYSYNEYIEDMISYFEQTGMTPQGKFKISHHQAGEAYRRFDKDSKVSGEGYISTSPEAGYAVRNCR